MAQSPASLFAELSKSVVIVDSKDDQGGEIALGSGVVVGSRSVITNWHVVKEGSLISVRRGAKTYHADIVFADADRDLCQLKVMGLTAPAVRLGSVKDLVVGQRVISIGAPEGLELTLTDGLISSLRPRNNSLIIQTTAPISHGSSGGGLFDTDGRLIGITTFQVVDGQNLNFALPVDWIPQLQKGTPISKTKEGEQVSAFVAKLALLCKNEDYRTALRLAKAEVERNPKNKLGWYYMGAALNNLGRQSEAVDAFEHALEIDSKFELALRSEGAAFMKLGRFDEAENNFQQAVVIDERDGLAWNLLAVVQLEKKDYDAAIGSATRAVAILPDNGSYLGMLGIAYYHAQDYPNAATNLRAAVRLNPMDQYNWSFLGLTDSSLGIQDEMDLAFKNTERIKRGEQPVNLPSEDVPPALPPAQ